MILHNQKKIYCKDIENELKSYHNKINFVSKFWTDAGFLTTVEVGQYFMTKDTEEFSQFTDSVACRQYILPRDESLSEPKGWIRGNTKIGPVLEVTTCSLQGGSEMQFKDCVEIECTCFCKPIKGQSKTTKTYFCQLIHTNYTFW